MLKLGPELFDLLNQKQWVGNQQPVVYGKGGLSTNEITEIELQLGFSLPSDFAYLLRSVTDEGGVLFPWKHFDKQRYDEMIAWVRQGIEFDIEHANIWLLRWGAQPHELSDAIEIFRNDFTSWPKLLPVCGHRCLAAEPCEADNPVFSIMQTDIIYYGANLAHYLVNEFVEPDWEFHTLKQSPKRIEIWSDFAKDWIGEGFLAWPVGVASGATAPWAKKS